MEETGDTGIVDTGGPAVCPRVSGSGCGPTRPVGAECTEEGQPEPEVQASPGEIRGGACRCDPISVATVHDLPAVGWVLVVLAVALLRRVKRVAGLAAALVFFGAVHPAAAQVNAQQLRVVDGGDFTALRDADLGPRWSGAATVSLNHARDLVILEGVPNARVLVEQVTTRALSASLNLGGVTRLGFSAPWHWPATVDGDRYRLVPGDIALWIAVPLTGDDNPLSGSWTVQLDLPSGADDLYLGDPGVVRGLVALEAPAGPLRLLGNLSLNFHRDVPLPGVVYGNHWGYGLGLRAEPMGPVFATLELTGESPIAVWAGAPSQYPLESLLSVGTVPTRVLSLSGGIGTGLTRGVGSPSLRLIAMVDVRPRTERDADDDGISDLRDLCRLQPEDRDGFHDSDGCPDPDNDQDGLLDTRDDCPQSAEDDNGYQDDDGCPERVTFLTLRVEGGDDLEQAEITLGADPPFVVLPGEPVEQALELDSVTIAVRAEGHHPSEEDLELGGTPTLDHTVRLEPVVYGELALSVVGPDGAEIPAARIEIDGGDALGVPDLLTLPTGPASLRITAEGWGVATREVRVPADDRLSVEVVLDRERVRVEGSRLQVADPVDFALDEATLLPEGERAVDDLARWLADHPEVALLRIEGHADTTGTSRHNLQLSRARADAVRARLEDRGIDPERLEAIGTGEARPASEGGDESRRVEFLVLVYEE